MLWGFRKRIWSLSEVVNLLETEMEKNNIWEVLGRNGKPRVGVRMEQKDHITSRFAKSSPSQTFAARKFLWSLR